MSVNQEDLNIYYEVGVTQKCTLLHLGMYQYKKINMKKNQNIYVLEEKEYNFSDIVAILLFTLCLE